MRILIYLCLPIILMACATTSTIHTQPLGAEVHINGQRCGVSPCIHHERYGFPDRMRVQIRSPGYESAEFFVDTEPPVASFLLYGFGSYFLHGFAKEYRFSLKISETLDSENTTPFAINGDFTLQNEELTNALEQCLFWNDQQSTDIWNKRFIQNATSFDCKLAESILNAPQRISNNLTPSLARALLRYADFRQRNNMPNIETAWSIKELCEEAKIDYAKRIGASIDPPAFPVFDAACPEESKQLRVK